MLALPRRLVGGNLLNKKILGPLLDGSTNAGKVAREIGE